MTMEELYRKIIENRSSVFEEIEVIEENGYYYPIEEERYDEGYLTALNWVCSMIEEAQK